MEIVKNIYFLLPLLRLQKINKQINEYNIIFR